MGRPIKLVVAEPVVAAELRRRPRATTIGVRDRDRASMIVLRLEGLSVAAVAARLQHHAKAGFDLVAAV